MAAHTPQLSQKYTEGTSNISAPVGLDAYTEDSVVMDVKSLEPLFGEGFGKRASFLNASQIQSRSMPSYFEKD